MRARSLFTVLICAGLAAPAAAQQAGDTTGTAGGQATWRNNDAAAAGTGTAAAASTPAATTSTQSSTPGTNPGASMSGAGPVRSPAFSDGDSGRSAGSTFAASPPAGMTSQDPPAARASVASSSRAPITRVTAGNGSLPNEQGQLYREYDISPYALRVTTTKHPEQAIVDWIRRETGDDIWHGEPLAFLSATSKTLRVYHTPQIQATVAEIVDRFNSSETEAQAFSLRVITVDSPNWRERYLRSLNSVPVQTPGVQAWMLEKEAAAALLAGLRRRSDYREHNSPQLTVTNGQPMVVSAMRGRNYIRSVKLRADAWPGFEQDATTVDEGFALEFTPLLAGDGRTVDATVKCDIDQVERMVPVMMDVPTAAAPRQRTKIEVPQIAHFRFHERFRWPVEQVLVIGLGVVADPVPSESKPLVPGIPLLTQSGPPRADLLLVVENRGRAAQAPRVTRGLPFGGDLTRGR
jgi:hypothetical protein